MAGVDGSAFEIVVHGREPRPGAVDAMRRGLSRVNAPADTSTVFTDKFVDDIRQVTGNPTYEAKRGAGVTGAICLPHSDHSSQIFVNATEYERFDNIEMERLLAHEGAHAVLRSRDEAQGERPHDGLVDYEWQWAMMFLGGVAGEEFRVEAALRGLGYRPSDMTSTVNHMEHTLATLNNGFLETVWEASGFSPEEMADRIAREHFTLAIALAHLAAYADHPDVQIPANLSKAGMRHWRDYVGPMWPERKKVYANLPNALQPLTSDERDTQLRGLYALEMKQLERIGFEHTGSDTTGSFLRIATVKRCTERLAATAELADKASQTPNP